MKKFTLLTITVLALLTAVPIVAAQEAADTATEDAARAQRQARIEELRQLTREEREARREGIQRRLEGLTDDERQALRERRRLQQQARPQRGTGRATDHSVSDLSGNHNEPNLTINRLTSANSSH